MRAARQKARSLRGLRRLAPQALAGSHPPNATGSGHDTAIVRAALVQPYPRQTIRPRKGFRVDQAPTLPFAGDEGIDERSLGGRDGMVMLVVFGHECRIVRRGLVENYG